jgi:hypothetical protein
LNALAGGYVAFSEHCVEALFHLGQHLLHHTKNRAV